jgi:hypothetical protein
MAPLGHPSDSSACAASVSARKAAGVPLTSMRSIRTSHVLRPTFTGASGAVWTWPLSASASPQRADRGGSASSRAASPTPPLWKRCACGPQSRPLSPFAFGTLGSAARSSR